MTTMLEKMVDAIRGPLWESAEVAEHMHEQAAVEAARAALLAIREPDHDTTAAVVAPGMYRGKAADDFSAMIDAILNEGKPDA